MRSVEDEGTVNGTELAAAPSPSALAPLDLSRESGRGCAGPRRLLAATLLGCFVAALFGATPLADWATGIDLAVAGTAADTWRDLTRQVALDRPYDLLRHAVRRSEAFRFGAGD